MMEETRKKGAHSVAEVRECDCWCFYALLLCGPVCSVLFPKLIPALVMCVEGVDLLQSVNDRQDASMDG